MKKILIGCLLFTGMGLFAASGFNEYEEIDPDCTNCEKTVQENVQPSQKQNQPCNVNVVGNDMCSQSSQVKQQVKASSTSNVDIPVKKNKVQCCNVLTMKHPITITVTGQGVAPVNTISPAQAYALAKRAAIADAYRLIAEKVRGVEVEGEDLVKNMMVKRSTVRTTVYALVRNANITETTFRDGLCEVEMEIKLYYEDFVR